MGFPVFDTPVPPSQKAPGWTVPAVSGACAGTGAGAGAIVAGAVSAAGGFGGAGADVWACCDVCVGMSFGVVGWGVVLVSLSGLEHPERMSTATSMGMAFFIMLPFLGSGLATW